MARLIEFRRPGLVPRRPEGDIDCCIRQATLDDILALRRRVHEARRARNHIEAEVLWMLRDGRPVEPGAHTAYTLPIERAGYPVRPSSFDRLVVR